MAINLGNISKLVKIANGVSNPRQAINMLLTQIEKKDPKTAQQLKMAVNSGKDPVTYIKEQAQSGVINKENFNDVKSYYKMAQKMGLAHKVNNNVWNEIEEAINSKATNTNSFTGF